MTMLLPFPGELILRRLLMAFGIHFGFGGTGLALGHLALFQSLAAQDHFLCQGLLSFRVRDLGMMDFLSLWNLADESGKIEVVDHLFHHVLFQENIIDLSALDDLIDDGRDVSLQLFGFLRVVQE
jgi:hypothetical protein